MMGKIKQIGKRIYSEIKNHIYQTFYGIMLFVLWLYIVCNWEKCVTMQFFSHFDGNNILFLVGILLVILPFYEVEGGGLKIRRTGVKELEKDLKKEESEFQKTVIQNTIMMQSQSAQRQTEVIENDEL